MSDEKPILEIKFGWPGKLAFGTLFICLTILMSSCTAGLCYRMYREVQTIK